MALALAWLEREAADARDEWTLLARKAERWIEAQGVAPVGAANWNAAAVAFLS